MVVCAIVIVCAWVATLGSAWASEPGSEGDVNPKTEWKPVLESRAAVEVFGFNVAAIPPEFLVPGAEVADENLDIAGYSYFDLAARMGAEVQRRALSARITIASDGHWYARRNSDGDLVHTGGWATVPYLSEAWVNLNPKISESLETSVRVGRQPVQFHEGRILGRDDRTLRGEFPDAARVLLRGDPLQVEVIGGADVNATTIRSVVATEPDSEPRLASELIATPLLFARTGLSRENPATHWVADAVFATAWVAEDERKLDTVGFYGKLDTGRVRSRLDVYAQPDEQASAWLGGAKLGYAIGDDARVVLGVLGEARSAEGGGTRAFTRPWRNTGEDFGLLDLYEPDDVYGTDGVVDTAAYTEAKVVPSLRIDGEVHLLSALASSQKQAEIDADIHWWLTPHAQLRLRSAFNVPFATSPEVRSLTSISLDLAI